LIALPATFVLQAKTETPAQTEALKWARSHRVDAVVSFANLGGLFEKAGLLAPEMLVIATDDQDWDRLTVPELKKRLKDRLSDWSFIPQVEELMTAVRLPVTFLFQTRDGGAGILQISGFSVAEHRVAFRYRMVAAPPHVAEAVVEKKPAPAAPLPPPNITLLDIERHTRGTIEAWDREGKALSNQIRWIVKPDVILHEEGESREERDHYLVSLMVENLPPDEITHGGWSGSFGDGVGSTWLASFHPPDGMPGSLYRMTAEIPPGRKRVDFRFGIPIRNWEPVLVLHGPAWEAVERRAPFDGAETTGDFGSRVSLTAGVLPQHLRGLSAELPMTRLKLKLLTGVHYGWDWHPVLVDAAGQEYEPDLGGGWRAVYTEFPLDEYDPNMLTADFHLPERFSIVKIIVKARSHERDYQWAEFKDLPLTSATQAATP
jgi:hypothetical protein